MRDDTLCMMRIKNEERWLRRSLERTWQVCSKVVIFDDHSTDKSLHEAYESLGCGESSGSWSFGKTNSVYRCNDRELHWLLSPFQDLTEEVRDKNFLWEYVSRLKFRHVLCLDGDEMLSLRAIRWFPAAIDYLVNGGSVGVFPFVYLWNEENLRRVDGVYRDIRHARLFTVDRAPAFPFARFISHGRAGFHCGSIPEQLNFGHRDMPEMEIIHMGYLDDGIRQKKFVFYNQLDPGNEGEGFYRHIIGQTNHLAPGPVRLVEYKDQ